MDLYATTLTELTEALARADEYRWIDAGMPLTLRTDSADLAARWQQHWTGDPRVSVRPLPKSKGAK